MLLVFPVPAVVQSQVEFTSTTVGGAVTITKYTGAGGAVSIPDTISGLPVTAIGGAAFRFSTNLTGVTMPDSIRNIGFDAFYDCASLSKITLPTSITKIEDLAFLGCTSLTALFSRGNAPSISDGSILADPSVSSVTVYYLPGTTGWDATFGSRPTAMWIPVIPNLVAGTADSPLRLITHSPAPASVRVQRSVNLRDWEEWQTVTRTDGPSELRDDEAATNPYRFYRGIEE